MRIVIILNIIFVFFLFACRSDSSYTDEKEWNTDYEAMYFEDYEPPLKKWGFIDTTGKIVITSKYDDARRFHNGRAIVNYKGKWGIIDKNDNKIVDFQYRSLFEFQNGRARFQTFDQKYGYLNEQGEIVIPAEYSEAADFSCNRAKVSINGLYQYIDINGKVIIDMPYTKAGNFNNNEAVVQSIDHYGTIDTLGQEIIPAKYDKIYSKEGAYTRVKSAKKYGYYKHSQLIIPPHYNQATDFYNGIAAVKENNQWKFIRPNGKVVTVLDYDQLEYINEGLWKVYKNKKWGIIDSKGKEITGLEYDLLYRFSDKKCAYGLGGFWGFLDLSGNPVTSPEYALVWDYYHSFARAISKEGLMILNHNAEPKFKSPSLDIRDFDEGLAPIAYMELE